MRTVDRSSRWQSGLFLVMSILALLWIILPSAFSNSTTSLKDTVMDIHVHDTYFIIANAHVFGLLSFLGLCFSAFYLFYTRVTGLRLSNVLGWAHVIGSGAIVLLTALILVDQVARIGTPRRYYSYGDAPMFEGVIDFITLWLMLGIIAQSCFVVNLAVSPFRKRSE